MGKGKDNDESGPVRIPGGVFRRVTAFLRGIANICERCGRRFGNANCQECDEVRISRMLLTELNGTVEACARRGQRGPALDCERIPSFWARMLSVSNAIYRAKRPLRSRDIPMAGRMSKQGKRSTLRWMCRLGMLKSSVDDRGRYRYALTAKWAAEIEESREPREPESGGGGRGER